MRIYVGRLPFTSKSADLRDLFAQAGTVTEASVIEDRLSGQSKCFGFVEMPDASEAKAAITQFNGYSHNGRPLTVIEAKEAKPPEDRNSSLGVGVGRSRGAR